MRRIELWYDAASDSDDAVWCVSLCEEDGEEVKCLSTFEDYGDAHQAAIRAAAKRNIACHERHSSGELTDS